jgi:RNA polymerase-binding transcription factor
MTKIELNRFQHSLKKKMAELENGNRNRGAIAIETSPDELDRIQHGQERDLAMGALDRDSKLLREVRSALIRVDAGTYGICSDCEEDISLRRLTAVPWAASCIVCRQTADSLSEQHWNAGEELLVGTN